MHADTLKKIVNPNNEADTGSLTKDATSTEQQIIVDDSSYNIQENPKHSQNNLPPTPPNAQIETQIPDNLRDIPHPQNIATSVPVQNLMPDRVLSPPNFVYAMPLPPNAPEMAYEPLHPTYQYQPYQNVIEMNNNSYGTITRISNFPSSQPVSANVLMPLQTPMMSGGQYLLNRYSLMSPPPPQQFEINVYNTLPQSKSVDNLCEPTYAQTIPNLPPLPILLPVSSSYTSSTHQPSSESAVSVSQSSLYVTPKLPVASSTPVLTAPTVQHVPFSRTAPISSTTSISQDKRTVTTISAVGDTSSFSNTSETDANISGHTKPPSHSPASMRTSEFMVLPASLYELPSVLQSVTSSHVSNSLLEPAIDSVYVPDVKNICSTSNIPPISSSRPLVLPPPLMDLTNSTLISEFNMDDLKVPPPPPEFDDVSSLLTPDTLPPLPKTPPPPLPKTPPPSLKVAQKQVINNEIFSSNMFIPFSNKEDIVPSSSKSETNGKPPKFLNNSQISGEWSELVPNTSVEKRSSSPRSSTNRDSKIISEWMLSGNIATSNIPNSNNMIFTEIKSIVPTQIIPNNFDSMEKTLSNPEPVYELVSPKPFDENKPVYQKLVKEVTVTESSSTLLQNQSSFRESFHCLAGTSNSIINTKGVEDPSNTSTTPQFVSKEISSAYSLEKQFKGGVISKISRREQISPTLPKTIRPQVPPPPVPIKKVPPPVPPKKATLRSSKSEENILDSESTEKKANFKKSNARPVSLIFTAKQNLGFGKETLGRHGSLEKVINCFLTHLM